MKTLLLTTLSTVIPYLVCREKFLSERVPSESKGVLDKSGFNPFYGLYDTSKTNSSWANADIGGIGVAFVALIPL
jgi:hypothetical protein